MRKKVYFRVDANSKIGVGHFVRSLGLAYELSKQDCDITFVSRDSDDAQFPLWDRFDFDLLKISESSGNEVADAEAMNKILQGDDSIVVLDHPSYGFVWEKLCSAKRTVSVDGSGGRTHCCDFLVNPNPQPHAQNTLLPEGGKLLLGSQYALINPIVAQHLDQEKGHVRENEIVSRIVVCLGAVKEVSFYREFIEGLNRDVFKDIEFDFVFGWGYPVDEIRKIVESLSVNLNIFEQPDHLGEIFSKADLGVLSSGTIRLDSCATGLPSIFIGTAPDQIISGPGIESVEAGVFLGMVEEVSVSEILERMALLCSDYELRRKFSENAMKYADGKGAERIAREVLL